MFSLDLSQLVKNLDGTDATFGGTSISLREVVYRSLVGLLDGDASLSIEARMYKMDMAKIVRTNSTISLTIADVVMLSPLIARAFPQPLVLLSFFNAVEDSLTKPQAEKPQAENPPMMDLPNSQSNSSAGTQPSPQE